MVSAAAKKRRYAHALNGFPDTPSKERDESLDIFFVSTTKQEKIDQLNAVAEHYKMPALFMRVTDLGKPSHSPEELTGSFKHNKNTKLFSCAKHLSQFSYEQVVHAMDSLGFSAADLESGKIRLHGCAEDSGLSFVRNGPKSKTEEFVDMFFNTGPNGPYRTDPDREMVKSLERFSAWETNKDGEKKRKPFPGVETVRVLGAAGGVANFFRLTNLTMEKLGLAVDAEKHPEKLLVFKDDSVLGSFAWDPKLEKNFAAHLAKHPEIIKEGMGISKSFYDGKAFKPGDDVTDREITTYGHSIPSNMASRKQFVTREDMSPIFQPVSRSRAMLDLMGKLGIAKVDDDKQWTKYVEKRGFNLGANAKNQHYSVSLIPGDGNYPYAQARDYVRGTIESAGIKVTYPGEDAKGADIKHLPRLWSDINLTQQAIDRNDAMVLMPSGAKEHLDKTRELEQFILGAYFCVAKTLEPTGQRKIGIFLENEKGDYDRFIRQLNGLFNYGAFGDRPSTMFRKATTPEETVEILEDHRLRYRVVPPTVEADTPVPDLKDKTGKFVVCVFSSAGKEGIYEDKTMALGKRLQATNMMLNYGAADRNMMGGSLKGVVSAAKARGEAPAVMGSTTTVIGATENEHGHKPHEIPDAMYYHAPNITKRKEFLFKNSHAFVLLEGGVGTLDELLTYMYYQSKNSKMTRNKPMVISESAYTQDSMFKQTLELFLGESIGHLDGKDRERIFKQTGIMLMEAPTKIPAGSSKKLYQMEMDEVVDFLSRYREKNYPQLVHGGEKNWEELESSRRRSSPAATGRHH